MHLILDERDGFPWPLKQPGTLANCWCGSPTEPGQHKRPTTGLNPRREPRSSVRSARVCRPGCGPGCGHGSIAWPLLLVGYVAFWLAAFRSCPLVLLAAWTYAEAVWLF